MRLGNKLFVVEDALFVQKTPREPLFRKEKRDIAVCGERETGDRPGVARSVHIAVGGGESAVNYRIALCPGFQYQLVEPEPQPVFIGLKIGGTRQAINHICAIGVAPLLQRVAIEAAVQTRLEQKITGVVQGINAILV